MTAAAHDRFTRATLLYLRVALAAGFLSAVADRLGWWGAPGEEGVVWGSMPNFFAYTSLLNPYLPEGLIPALGWFVTLVEIALAVLLLAGLQLRLTGLASAALISLFGLSMLGFLGPKAPLDYSVFAAAAASLAVAALASREDSGRTRREGGPHSPTA